MSNTRLSRGALIRLVVSRAIFFIPVMFAFFFLPAGTIDYWQAWVWLAIIFIPMLFVMGYLLKNDPELLERRMRMREKQPQQKIVIALSLVYFLVAFTLPGFDRRFGWSQVPLAVVIAADICVLAGYLTFFLVMRENSYASRVIEVAEGQKVISTGPYALVRHPMYLGVVLMYVTSPIALGSFWALIPAVLIVPILVMRIVNEEQVLAKGLPGYTEYMQRVRYRLFPKIW